MWDAAWLLPALTAWSLIATRTRVGRVASPAVAVAVA
eukprot:gene42626-64190_t